MSLGPLRIDNKNIQTLFERPDLEHLSNWNKTEKILYNIFSIYSKRWTTWRVIHWKKKNCVKKTCEIGEIVLVIILILIGILKFIE